MANTRRALTTAGIALGIALGTPALAAADTGFYSQHGFAGHEGATMTVTRSVANDDGTVSYVHVTYTAGPDGATVDHTTSSAS